MVKFYVGEYGRNRVKKQLKLNRVTRKGVRYKKVKTLTEIWQSIFSRRPK